MSHGGTARIAKRCGDEQLAKMCGLIAADEGRHEAVRRRHRKPHSLPQPCHASCIIAGRR